MKQRTEEEKLSYCRNQGIVPEHHCCTEMAYCIARPVEVEHQGPNRVIDWIAGWNEYLIPVAYDGYSSTNIQFCPFCGDGLPPSKRDQWYEALYALGYNDPTEQEIPNAFNTDEWWRNANR